MSTISYDDNELFDDRIDIFDSEGKKMDINLIFSNFDDSLEEIKNTDEYIKFKEEFKNMLFCSAYLYVFMDNLYCFNKILIELEKRDYDLLEVRDHADLNIVELCEMYGKQEFIEKVFESIARQEARQLSNYVNLEKSEGSNDGNQEEHQLFSSESTSTTVYDTDEQENSIRENATSGNKKTKRTRRL